MTLDEAIVSLRKSASKSLDYEWQREQYQIAEWLEELKLLREEKSEFQIIARDNYEIAYNKAIDDFVESISLPLSDEDICRIVEQLKERDAE